MKYRCEGCGELLDEKEFDMEAFDGSKWHEVMVEDDGTYGAYPEPCGPMGKQAQGEGE